MNFLAHIFLSGEHPLVQLGNFIADSVKGRMTDFYGEEVRKGIILHRKIDDYTDHHPVFIRSKRRLGDGFGHYAGVLVDMIYDHFLAANWKKFHSTDLEVFSQRFYCLLNEHFELLPVRFQHMLPYMIKYNWLVSYSTLDGLGKILTQMDQRTLYRSNMRNALPNIKANYKDYEMDFFEFFLDISNYLKEI